MKLCSAIYDDFYPFNSFGLFEDYKVVRNPKELDKDSTLLVWGGEDISPRLYNRQSGQHMWADEISRRDHTEWMLMERATELGIPIIGICRGAQMLCAKAGGILYQHVNNHAGAAHLVELDGYEPFKVNSLHHQMMEPKGTDHKLIAWSKQVLSDVHFDVNENVPVEREPEMVYFPKLKGIAVQWHPEMMRMDTPANKFLCDWLKDYYGRRA